MFRGKSLPPSKTLEVFSTQKKEVRNQRLKHLWTKNRKAFRNDVVRHYLNTLTETNTLHQKTDGWKTSCLLGWHYFQGDMLVLGRVSESTAWASSLVLAILAKQTLPFDLRDLNATDGTIGGALSPPAVENMYTKVKIASFTFAPTVST